MKRIKAVVALAVGLFSVPAMAYAADVPNGTVWFNTSVAQNWESGHWGSAQSGSSAYVCGDIQNSNELTHPTRIAIVRDLQGLPDPIQVSRDIYGGDPTLCTGRTSIVSGNSYYTRASTQTITGSPGGWASARY